MSSLTRGGCARRSSSVLVHLRQRSCGHWSTQPRAVGWWAIAWAGPPERSRSWTRQGRSSRRAGSRCLDRRFLRPEGGSKKTVTGSSKFQAKRRAFHAAARLWNAAMLAAGAYRNNVIGVVARTSLNSLCRRRRRRRRRWGAGGAEPGGGGGWQKERAMFAPSGHCQSTTFARSERIY